VAWSEDRTKLIQIAEPLQAAGGISVHGRFASLFGLFLISLAALLVIDAWMIRRAMRALQDSAGQLTQRSSNDLRPIEVHSPPREVQPLVSEINALFRRFANALENERRFTSAAAHELRTPLAAVKVHAQVAQLTRTAAERKKALQNLLLAIDRASHMVDQLLTLSRLDGMIALRTAASPAAAGRDRRPRDRRGPPAAGPAQSADRGQSGRLRDRRHGVRRCLAAAQPDRQRDALRTAGTRNPRDGPPRRRPRTGRRRGCRAGNSRRRARNGCSNAFYRLYGDGDGCGIGLSIVRTVAETHKAQIDLDASELGGLRVRVAFPKHTNPPTLTSP